MSLDDLDTKIIRALRENCLTPFVEIAKRLGVTDGTIHQRVKKLQQKGIIQRFTVLLDPIRIGLGVIAFILVSVAPGFVEPVAKALAQLERVVEVHEVHTYGDLLVKLRANDMNELRELLVQNLKTIPGVVGSQVISVLKVWKEDNTPVP